ncbi:MULTISPECIES: MerR family DNA-binding transcriptional regulator [unclassified Endozoicomonas]|uniref:MerR family DNA-binding transcriptional regulator n=2 Tax=Endozoicomonas TaxID=305899 RepID=UPI003BB49C99
MNDRYSISRAADHLGVSPSTLRRWEACGKLVPERTAGGKRRYSASQLMTQQTPQVQHKTVAYSRVSSHDQKKDLERQQEVFINTMVRHCPFGLPAIRRGVKEILLSQRTIISPLAGDLLKQEGIKLRYNDNTNSTF